MDKIPVFVRDLHTGSTFEIDGAPLWAEMMSVPESKWHFEYRATNAITSWFRSPKMLMSATSSGREAVIELEQCLLSLRIGHYEVDWDYLVAKLFTVNRRAFHAWVSAVRRDRTASSAEVESFERIVARVEQWIYLCGGQEKSDTDEPAF